jgi:hypothetical protein
MSKSLGKVQAERPESLQPISEAELDRDGLGPQDWVAVLDLQASRAFTSAVF